MSDSKTVSVLICTHNAASFISGTLSSVFAQTYREIEIFIHDDASKDNTVDILAKIEQVSPFPITVLGSNTNIGPYKGLNLLLSNASGDYIAILDHDDLWHKDKTRLQVEFLNNNANYLACGAMIHVLWEEYNKVSTFSAKKHDIKAYHNTLVFRNTGNIRYREDFLYRNDFHLMRTHLCQNGLSIYNLQAPLAIWRMRRDNKNLSRRWAGLSAICEYCCATRDITGSLLGFCFQLTPKRIAHHLLLRRHASNVFDYHPGMLDDLLGNTGTSLSR